MDKCGTANNVFVGARYVPLILGEWSATEKYEPLTVVLYQGTSYTSRTYVPAGIVPSESTSQYWALTGNYNAQVEMYRQEVEKIDNRVQNMEMYFTYVYDSTVNLINSDNPIIKDGDYVKTLGYTTKGDGGESKYLITATQDLNKYQIKIGNLYGTLLFDETNNIRIINSNDTNAINTIFNNDVLNKLNWYSNNEFNIASEIYINFNFDCQKPINSTSLININATEKNINLIVNGNGTNDGINIIFLSLCKLNFRLYNFVHAISITNGVSQLSVYQGYFRDCLYGYYVNLSGADNWFNGNIIEKNTFLYSSNFTPANDNTLFKSFLYINTNQRFIPNTNKINEIELEGQKVQNFNAFYLSKINQSVFKCIRYEINGTNNILFTLNLEPINGIITTQTSIFNLFIDELFLIFATQIFKYINYEKNNISSLIDVYNINLPTTIKNEISDKDFLYTSGTNPVINNFIYNASTHQLEDATYGPGFSTSAMCCKAFTNVKQYDSFKVNMPSGNRIYVCAIVNGQVDNSAINTMQYNKTDYYIVSATGNITINKDIDELWLFNPDGIFSFNTNSNAMLKEPAKIFNLRNITTPPKNNNVMGIYNGDLYWYNNQWIRITTPIA